MYQEMETSLKVPVLGRYELKELSLMFVVVIYNNPSIISYLVESFFIIS